MEPSEKTSKKKNGSRRKRLFLKLSRGVITQEDFDRMYISREEARKQLKRIVKRDGNICSLCRKVVSPNEGSREHIVSLWEGGTNKDENIVLSHQECNNLKNEYEKAKQRELRNK